jgi:hypothetical protein
MRMNSKILIVSTLCFIFIGICFWGIDVYAEWLNQEEIISGTWGSETTQFGLEKGDTIAFDMFPLSEYYLLDGILIWDTVNGRMKKYTYSGALLKVIKCVESSTGQWNEECRIDGTFIKILPDGNFYTSHKGKFLLYSSVGELLQTMSTRPLELGKITINKISSSQYKYEIEYPEAIYIYEGAKDMFKENGIVRVNTNLIMQNFKDKVYAYKVVEEIPVNEGEKKKYKIDKVSEWVKPEDQYVQTELDQPDHPIGFELTIIAEYGNAVIGPDGSIYTWMRTETNYKILRWRWVE